jgi:hypothetical protein
MSVISVNIMSSLALVPRMGCKINVVLYGRIVITGLPENNTVLKDWPFQMNNVQSVHTLMFMYLVI